MYNETRPACPNCNTQLSKVPYSKSLCPYCEEIMYIRVQNGIRYIVNEDEREYIDNEREKARNRRYYTRSAIRGASKGCIFGIFYLIIFLFHGKK